MCMYLYEYIYVLTGYYKIIPVRPFTTQCNAYKIVSIEILNIECLS